MFAVTNYENPVIVLAKLFKHLRIYITPEQIAAELDVHPDYPSMLSLSDVLIHFNVNNESYYLEATELSDVPCPFIAHTYLNGSDFLIINKVKEGSFWVSNESWDNHRLTLENFKDIYSGVVLIAESSEITSANILIKNFRSSLKILTLISSVAIILLLSLYHVGYFVNLNWNIFLLTIFKSTGIGISILLLIQSVDKNNPLVQTLCQVGGKANCDAILSSDAAKVFEGLTWSEVGFFYFAGTWLLLLYNGNSIFTWQILFFLNVVSLPYTIYSIYYQVNIAKQWCILCCAVQVLLWLEFIPLGFFISRSTFSTGKGYDLVLVIICFFVPIILWIFLKPLFLKLQQLQPLKQQLRQFKYNNELFHKMLTAQPKYTQPDEEWCIVLGNVEATNSIIMVTNPYCEPCASTHRLLDELLYQRADIQARIIFSTSNADEDTRIPVSRHLMALNEQSDKNLVKRAMHDWYKQKHKNYNVWAKAYPVDLSQESFYKLDKQRDWCQIADITATPILLVNGHRLPNLYNLTDLKYMLQ